MPRTPLLTGVPLPAEPRVGADGAQGGVPGPRQVYVRKNFQDLKAVLQSPQRRKRVERAMRDDAVGDERLEEPKRWKGEVAPGPGVVMGQRSSSGVAAGSGDVHASRRTRRTAEEGRLPILQDLAESRPGQSAHRDTMRLGELSSDTSELAEVFCFERLAVCSTCNLKTFLA